MPEDDGAIFMHKNLNRIRHQGIENDKEMKETRNPNTINTRNQKVKLAMSIVQR